MRRSRSSPLVGPIYALLAVGETVYVGGAFTSIGDQQRHSLAAIDAATDQVTAWNSNVDGAVRALAVVGGTIVVGGDFTAVGGQNRHDLTAVDAATGKPSAWDPNVAGVGVSSLTVGGRAIYAGGWFTSVNGERRDYLASFDAATGRLRAWNPDANRPVWALAACGLAICAGGQFTTIGGRDRHHLAKLDAATGTPSAWNPDANHMVQALAATGTTVFAGGYLTAIGGRRRHNLAALDASTGQATAWDPHTVGGVSALAVRGRTVYAAGEFTSVDRRHRRHLAALDAATGTPIAWNPGTNAVVSTVLLDGRTLYAGGEFTSIGHRRRRHLAALDAVPSQIDAPDPRVTYATASDGSGTQRPPGRCVARSRGGTCGRLRRCTAARHRESSRPTARPSSPTGFGATRSCIPAAGAGPLFHRVYRARIREARLGPRELVASITADLDRVAPSEFARLHKVAGEEGTMAVGDEYVVRMPGPWDGPVRVVERTPSSFRFVTLDGHLEAGQIRFAAERGDLLEFRIESWARAGDRLSNLLYHHLRMSKEVQLHIWTSMLERVAELAGGRLTGGIEIRTWRVDVVDAG